MIIDPVLRTTQPERAIEFIAESMTWHLWPKMVPVNRRRPMSFAASWNGKPIPVPDPTRLQPLPGFIRALQVLREGSAEGVTPDGIEVFKVAAQRPKTTLGALAVSRFAYRTRFDSASLTDEEGGDESPTQASPFSGPSHHVVLLRKPELVVTYMPGPSPPEGDLQWGGVFLAASEHNEAFARAEPPTHDSWEPGTVEDRMQRRIVNIALREIQKHVNRVYRPVVPTADSNGQSVVRVANALGPLFAGVPGQGGGVTSGGGGSVGTPAGRRSRPQVHVDGAGPVLTPGGRASEVRFRVVPSPAQPATLVRVAIDVAVGDSGKAEGEDRPAGAAVPTLIRIEGPVPIIDADGAPIADVDGMRDIAFLVDSPGETSWQVFATAPDDTATSFAVEADAAPPPTGEELPI